MREIVFDTETTGLDPDKGHRVVEIGCVELIDRVKTGRYFHEYVNPERSMPKAAEEVHGLSEEFLSDKPVFELIADKFLDFVGDSKLVIHNASFDMKFINFELAKASKPKIAFSRAIDTLVIARKKFPGAKASLDALCGRYGISLDKRDKHGALLDSELLADVYIELLGGAQDSLSLSKQEKDPEAKLHMKNQVDFPKRSYPVAEGEKKAHDSFLEKIKAPLWSSN